MAARGLVLREDVATQRSCGDWLRGNPVAGPLSACLDLLGFSGERFG